MIFSYEDEDAVKGIEYFYIGDFFGYFSIRKCMWSTPSTIKTTAASIKKFYKCMADHGEISKDKYKDLCTLFKEEMPDWQEECRRFNDDDDDFLDD